MQLIAEHADALIPILGVVVGAALTFLSTFMLSERDLRLKLREKLLDKRIESHEAIIELTKSLRTMVSLGFAEHDNDLRRCPAVLMDQESFDSWQAHFVSVLRGASTWLSNDVTKELNLLQDYQVNLREYLKRIPEESYPQFGSEIRDDFVQFSDRIEKLAFRFFSQELRKLQVGDIEKWHKYEKIETIRRLEDTEFFRKAEDFANQFADAG